MNDVMPLGLFLLPFPYVFSRKTIAGTRERKQRVSVIFLFMIFNESVISRVLKYIKYYHSTLDVTYDEPRTLVAVWFGIGMSLPSVE